MSDSLCPVCQHPNERHGGMGCSVEIPVSTDTLFHWCACLGEEWEYNRLRHQLAQRDAEIVELRKQLEWMIAHSAKVHTSRTKWWVEWHSSKQTENADRETDFCGTPYEAIDAAIAAADETSK